MAKLQEADGVSVTPVLARTFLFLPGIGPVREARLWRRGVDSWRAYRTLPRVSGIRPRLKARHDALLETAESMRHDPRFFARLLPLGEHWRAFGAFGKRAAYVDIETTGDRTNAVTVVGVRFGGRNRTFVRGRDYSPQAVSAFLADATCLVTFNGATFDLPVLDAEGVRLPAVPHVDLRTVFHRIGITGGLKRIEESLGMGREDEVRGLTGYDAVKLWRRWEARGDEDALQTLLAYNVADFENLQPLAEYACERLEQVVLADLSGQRRLDVGGPPATVPAGP